MKLAKKLLAVALAGVMAVSMLAGCSSSSSDKNQKEYAKALTNAVNSANKAAVQADSSNVSAVTYTHDSSLDSKAVELYGKIKNSTKDTLSSRAAATISDSNDPSLYGGKGYADGVLELNISDSKDLKNESNLAKYAVRVDQAIRKYLLTAQKTNPKDWPTGESDDRRNYVIKGSDMTAGTSNNPAKVSYGVQFYSANGRYYAVIVVETVDKTSVPQS